MNDLPNTHIMSEVIEYLEQSTYSVFTRNSNITIEYEQKTRKLKFTVHKVSGKNRIEYSGKVNPKMKFQEFLKKFEQVSHKNSAIWSATKKLLEQVSGIEEKSIDSQTNEPTAIISTDNELTPDQSSPDLNVPASDSSDLPNVENKVDDDGEQNASTPPNYNDLSDEQLVHIESGNEVVDLKINRLNQSLGRLKRKLAKLDEFVKENQGLTNLEEVINPSSQNTRKQQESMNDNGESTQPLISRIKLSPIEVNAEFGNFSLGCHVLQVNITSGNLQFRLMRFGMYELSTSGSLAHSYGYADARRAISDLFAGRFDNSIQQLLDHNEAKFGKNYPVSTMYGH